MTIRMRSLLAILLIFSIHSKVSYGAELDKDQAAIEKTSLAIRAAFARGDVDTIMLYHHPEVNKALAWNRYLVGRDAVAADLRANFQNFQIEFLEDKTESLRIQGDTAIQQDVVLIKGTPKQGGKPFFFQRAGTGNSGSIRKEPYWLGNNSRNDSASATGRRKAFLRALSPVFSKKYTPCKTPPAQRG
jgi:ketosteroid isomerase-like protein